ncbi:molecular chaperone [Sphingomonas sp. S2-65]|uniref:fimbrial biogenesis chaperone n=1 Tax=Sphingomonas sp. S2-65 TaxID=2903960 RepID=UPI001F2B092C|nr:fimbria/pilus periplasmic chaperone [Sphingomonas sp. S2-65]UYY59369.1 fimbria/pilus periplasmic chaperone [Sphingomonas sp. S2-65]
MVSNFARVLTRSAIVATAVIASATAVYAMRVSPMVVEMTTTGSDSTARVEVQNLNTTSLPFETRITRVDFAADGTTTETPADADFVVFPPQGILPQGARQVVRLQWVGGADIPASRAYYLSVNQLPTAAEPGQGNGGQVQLVYHMKALIVVSPPGAQPNVEVSAAKAVDFQPPAAKQGDPLPPKVPGVEITLKNTGRRHALMAQLRWVLEGTGTDGKALRLLVSSEELSRAIGSGYVPAAGGVRTYQLAVVSAFGPGPIKVKFLR